MQTNNKKKMRICKSAFYELVSFIAGQSAESGGFLFGSEEDYIIRKFVPDKTAKTTRTTFPVNSEFINPIIKEMWTVFSLSLIGIIHSHPFGFEKLSGPDIKYFTSLLNEIDRDKFYTPIVFTIPDGGLDVFPYVFADGKEKIELTEIEILPDGFVDSKTEVSGEENSKETNQFSYKAFMDELIYWTQKVYQILESISKILATIIFVCLIIKLLPSLFQIISKFILLWN